MPADGGGPGPEDEPACKVVDLAAERLERAIKWTHFRNDDMSSVDDATARRLLSEHGRLVRFLANKYTLPLRTLAPTDADDLYATGTIVLLQAWIRYDPDRGMKFSSWAAVSIRRAFAMMLREAVVGSARLPLDAEAPTPLSLDEPSSKGNSDHVDGWSIGEHLAADPDVVMDDRQRWVLARLHLLSPREQHVLLLSMREMTLVEIGAHVGVTRQRAEQILRKATNRLHWHAWDEGLLGDIPEPAEGAPPCVTPRRGRGMRLRLIRTYAATAEM